MSSILENSQNEVLCSAENLNRSVCSQDQEKADLLRRATQAHREYTDMVSVLCAAKLGVYPAHERVLGKDKTWAQPVSVAKVWLWSDSSLWPQTKSSLAGVLSVPCDWPKGENQILQ